MTKEAAPRREMANVASLRNVQNLLVLVERLRHRPFGTPGMACFFGYSGFGKTTAAIFARNAHFGRGHQSEVCHTKMASRGGAREMMLRISAALEVGNQHWNTSRLCDAVTEHLRKTQRVLIVDEADYVMTNTMVNMLREIHDDSDAPIILMGEQRLPLAIAGFPQTHRRMLAWEEALEVLPEELPLLGRIYCPEVEIAADLRAALVEHCAANAGYLTLNLIYMHEFAAKQALRRLTLEEWPAARFFTGNPPAVVRSERYKTVQAGARRAAAAAIPSVAELVARRRGAA
jgi:hypothetical protein